MTGRMSKEAAITLVARRLLIPWIEPAAGA
jgi:hypothetical protein